MNKIDWGLFVIFELGMVSMLCLVNIAMAYEYKFLHIPFTIHIVIDIFLLDIFLFALSIPLYFFAKSTDETYERRRGLH